MVKLIAISDLHLSNYKNFNKPTDTFGIGSRLQERLEAISKIFAYGTEHNIKHYVFNGDIFDKRQREHFYVIEYIVNNIISSFKETPKGSVLYLNVGNHDEQSQYLKPNSLFLFNNVNIEDHEIKVIDKLSQVERLSDNTSLMFIPFTEDIKSSKKSIQDDLDNLSQPTTVFAHLGVQNSVTGRYERILDGSYNLADIGWNSPYVKGIVLGHYHTRQVLQEQDNKKAWYQGNMLPMDFNDVKSNGLGAERGFDIIDTETGESQFVDLHQPPFYFANFNIFDKPNMVSIDDFSDIVGNDYSKVVLSEDTILDEELLDDLNNNDNVQVVIKPKVETLAPNIEIDEHNSYSDIVSSYCDFKGYSEQVKDKALEYIEQAQSQE